MNNIETMSLYELLELNLFLGSVTFFVGSLCFCFILSRMHLEKRIDYFRYALWQLLASCLSSMLVWFLWPTNVDIMFICIHLPTLVAEIIVSVLGCIVIQFVRKQKANNKFIKAINKLLLFSILCTMTSCRKTDEIIVYYKMGFVESPVSKSFEDFQKESDNHPADTVIYIEQELFNRYNSTIKELNIVDSGSENVHDYFIDIKNEHINIAMPLPVPDSLNEKIIIYTEENKQGEISADVLYELLCSARYFDFFNKEDLIYHPLVRKFRMPSDYTNYYEKQNTASDIPIRIKSRYKVILKVK